MCATGWSATGLGGTWTTQSTGPADIAAAIAAGIGRPVDYRPVAADGAARTAALLADPGPLWRRPVLLARSARPGRQST